MAKGPAPASTRLLTTVNSRYYPAEGVADAYCLNGRFPGKRESRAVNHSLDRDARGFLISVFAYPADPRSRPSAWQEPLERLSNQVMAGEGDIDTDINDLAEAALDVTGGLKLSQETSREPYFAGIILRDGEMAAVTVGDGLALIYRQEVLYPLTSHSKAIDPVDLYGDPVEGIEDFIAGEAGAIRYSNIAQIEEGDLFVLCNGELLDVIGQKEVMRLLSEAEDHVDAAGLLMTAAATQMPGMPVQVAVSKVDEIQSLDQAPKFSLGRFATQAMEPVMAQPPVAPPPAPAPPVPAPAADPGLARTQRYERQDMVDRVRQAPAPEPEPDLGLDTWSLPPLPVSEATEPFEAIVPRTVSPSPYRTYEDDYPAHEPGYGSIDSALGWDTLSGSSYQERGPVTGSGAGDLPVFAYTPEAQKRKQSSRSSHEGYGSRGRDGWDTGEEQDSDLYGYESYGDDGYGGYDDDYSRRRTRKPDGRRRLIFYAILIAIIVICIVALVKLLAGGKKEPAVTDPPTSTTPLVVPTQTTTTPTTTPDTDPTTPPTQAGQVHVVSAGDTWWGICLLYYDRASESLCEKLAEYNSMSVNMLKVGDKVTVPPLAELQGN